MSSFSTSEISFAVAVTIRMPLSLISSRRASSCRRFVSFWVGVSKRNWSTDLQTGVLSFVFDICKIARRNIHFITYLFAAFFAPRPRSFYSFSKCLEVIFFYRSFCHIYSPSYILLFPFLFGYVYTVPLNSHNNSYLYTCYCSCVRL